MACSYGHVPEEGLEPDMGMKPKVTEPKRSGSFDWITKLKPEVKL